MRSGRPRFVAAQQGWLERARARQRLRPRGPESWSVGTRILWREEAEIRAAAGATGPRSPWRPTSSGSTVSTATSAPFSRRSFSGGEDQLSERTWELAAQTRMPVRRVSVRNQRSRWGSCSRSGTISLNWRLIQTPESIRDYIILHELMHLKEMNHSDRFWSRVEEVCPGWREAEHWLREAPEAWSGSESPLDSLFPSNYLV